MNARRYFAWMVVFRKDSIPPAEWPEPRSEPGVRVPHRPPKLAAKEGQLWEMDDAFQGFDCEHYVDFYPAGIDRQDAINWYATNAADLKKYKAVNAFLINLFDPGGVPSGRSDGADEPVREDDPTDPHFRCKFDPKTDWTGDFESRGYGPAPLLPANWRDSLPAMPLPEDPAAECEGVKEAQQELDARCAAIELQARSWRTAVDPVLQQMGCFTPATPRILTLTALEQLSENVEPPLFLLKRRYMRGRPARCCDGIDPMFPKGSLLHPGHPAFPSGHATHAYAVAYFFIELLPGLDTKQKDDLLKAARDVAYNREVAGLHYGSDGQAGEVLARWLVQQAVQNGEFKSLMQRARMEWPEFGGAPPAA